MKTITLLLILTVHLDLFSQENNIRLVNFNHSTCDDSEDPDRIRQRIINQFFLKDTLFITLGIVAECDLDDPLIKITKSKDTLDFKIERKPISITKDTITQMIVLCDCCYQFDFKIAGLSSKNYYVRVNNEHIIESDEKYITYPIHFELLNSGDTINYSDKYALMQGLWIMKYKDGSVDKVIYKEDKPLSFKKYYQNGQLKCDCICRPNHNGLMEYIEETGDCKYWDENGNEIKK
jgi:hypothetical protein